MTRKSPLSRISLCALLGVAAILFAVTSIARAQESGTLRIAPDQWHYHTGDDPSCGAVNDSGCTWGPQPSEGFAGDKFYWKRAEVILPDELKNVPQLGLLAGDKLIAFQVFVNGHLIGGTSNPSFYQTGINSGGYLTFPSTLIPNGRLVLAIRSVPEWKGRTLGTPLPYVLAPADRIQTVVDAETWRYLRLNAVHYLCFAPVGFAGFVFLLLFSVNHRLRENLWLGASFAMVSVLRVVEVSPIVHIGVPTWLDMVIYLVANCFMPFFLIEFVFSFLQKPVPRVLRLVQILGLGDAYFAARLPLPAFLSWFAIHGTPTAILIATLTQLLMLPTCFRSKLPEMRWIGGSVLFITVENSARMAKQLGLPSPAQDVLWHGYDIDIRGISYLLFAGVMLIAMTFRLRRIQDRNRAVEQEIAAARSVQQILIPDLLPEIPGLRIESAYLPAQEVGGDFFQVLPMPNSADPMHPSAFVVLGDVSGKGLKAAMTVSLIVGTLRTYAESCARPSELLAGLNRRLHGRGDGFATCLALMIEPSGRITIANAAHPNPYVNGVEIPTEPNLPLGLSLDVAYAEIALQLDPEQTCTLVTDGVVEAASATTRELFGFDRTQAVSKSPASSIAEAARSFGLGAPQADDITVLTIARTAVAFPTVAHA